MEKETTENRGRNSKLLGVTLAVLLCAAAFVSGLEIGKGSQHAVSLEAGLFNFLSPASKPDQEADLREFWRVWNIMEEKFVTTDEGPDKSERIRGAIAGLVSSYDDPYTVYMPPEDATHFAEDIGGQFSGVGMEVGLRNGMITVIAPLPDSPAMKAGIQSGDVITRINEETSERMAVDQAVRLIRGDRGTEVSLTLYRQNETELIEVTITRDTITIPTMETSVEGDVFIIRLFSFNALAESKVQEALAEFKQKGYKKLVLDLRGNPGGYLESAVSIAGYFMPQGKVVVRESFGENKDEQVYRTSTSQLVNIDPDDFVVLIDGGSASASEILAGALAEHGVATTIGDTTFGKGSVQELVNLPDKSAVKVTIARWLTPEGKSFSDGGLAPDVKITRTPQHVTAGEDPQKEAALKWLKGERDLGEKVSFKF
ncbi:MAG: S41 family peptidase [Candidatus Paceibacterota bacterium]